MIWVNKRIPVKGFKAMAIWPVIFVREESKGKFTDETERHENIHFEQQKELLLVLFIVWYLIEWFIRLIIYKDSKKAYRGMSFEKEANAHEEDLAYLVTRKRYAFLKYL